MQNESGAALGSDLFGDDRSIPANYPRNIEGSSNHVNNDTKDQLDMFSAQLMVKFDDRLRRVLLQLTNPLTPPNG